MRAALSHARTVDDPQTHVKTVEQHRHRSRRAYLVATLGTAVVGAAYLAARSVVEPGTAALVFALIVFGVALWGGRGPRGWPCCSRSSR